MTLSLIAGCYGSLSIRKSAKGQCQGVRRGIPGECGQKPCAQVTKPMPGDKPRPTHLISSGGVESRHAPEVASPYVPQTKRALWSADSRSSARPARLLYRRVVEERHKESRSCALGALRSVEAAGTSVYAGIESCPCDHLR